MNIEPIESEAQMELEKVETRALSAKTEEEKIAEIKLAFKILDLINEEIMRRLSQSDVLDMDGKPYLTAAGARKFASPFKVYQKDLSAWVITEDGNQIDVNSPNAFKSPIKAVRVQGTVGSHRLGIEEVYQGGTMINEAFQSRENVIFYVKKAQENFTGRAIKKLLHLDGLTWDMLEKVGIKKQASAQVQHRTSQPSQNKEKAEELWQRLLNLAHGNVASAEQICQAFTEYEWKGKKIPGKKRPDALNDNGLKYLEEKIAKAEKETQQNEEVGDRSEAQQ